MPREGHSVGGFRTSSGTATLLDDTILRVLEVSARGLTVERICSRLIDAGSIVNKHEVVRALGRLNQGQRVEVGASRRWCIRRHAQTLPSVAQRAPDDYLVAVPCQALSGDGAAREPDGMPTGELAPSISLLKQLLHYYPAALRASDTGSPQGFAAQYGDSFVCLEPDAPWWPTSARGRTLVVPLTRLPQGFRGLLAKQNSKHVLIGYPLHLVTPRSDDTDTFIRPVAILRCRFDQTETHLRVHVPVAKPTISRDWLRDQAKYGGWSASRLLSWLLVEDDAAGFAEDDEAETADFIEIPLFASRLQSAAGRALHQNLLPGAVAGRIPRGGQTGYYNGVAIFAESSGKYSRSAISDLDRLSGESADRLGATALGPLFGEAGQTFPAIPVLHPFSMSESQLVATRAALSGPLQVITGPPGTGKSQVIAAIMISAAAAGRSVLLAARQHRAIDAVQERLEQLTGDRVLLVRANEAEGYSKFTFPDALKALQSRSGQDDAARRYETKLKPIADEDARRWALLKLWQDLKRASEQAGELIAATERLTKDRQRADATAGAEPAKRPSFFLRLIARLLRWPIVKALQPASAMRAAHFARESARLRAASVAVEKRIKAIRDQLSRETETPVSLSARIEEQSKAIVELLLDSLDNIPYGVRQRLAAIAGDAGLMGRQSLGTEAAQLILKHMPLWAVTTLAAGSRIPLEPGLFDYVIFDEASVTDTASAIPLLFRAKAAVIVGDPMQLSMISNIEPQEDRLLLERFDLLRSGIGRFAQGQTDLYQMAASALKTRPNLLTEHYRCHPDIAAYFNEAFYGRRLVALTNVTSLRIPKGFKAGLHWTDIKGSVASGTSIGAEGSAYSEIEAQAVVEQIRALSQQGFEGSVGVVTFFAPQAMRINQLAAKVVGASALDRMGVKVFTANKFQGDERDVILISLCLSPDMPTGARSFLMKERRLMNVAVSRARAICQIFGNRDYAAHCGIPHIEALVGRIDAPAAGRRRGADDRFDSVWEKTLYEALVARGHNPIPQFPVAGRFLDLALVDEKPSPRRQIDIEVDGVAFHTDAEGNRLSTDLWRDHQLRGLGWEIIRFWVYELRDDMEGCLERIDRAVAGRT